MNNPINIGLEITLLKQDKDSTPDIKEDIIGIAREMNERKPYIPLEECFNLLYNFIRSSSEIRALVEKEGANERQEGSTSQPYFRALKEHQRRWAYALQKEFHLEKDSGWRYGQRIIAEMIADNSYKKLDSPGLLID